MLVLSRKVGETVVIAGVIRVTVVEIHGGKVRLGIVAPEDIFVDRLEVHEERTAGGPVPARKPRRKARR